MTAVDDLIAELQQNRTSDRALDQPVRCNIDTFILALQEISSGISTDTGASPITGSRLTLTTSIPVLSSDVTGAISIFFTPYVGNKTLINNGTDFVSTEHSELSQALSDATKSPAAGAANSVYDMFVWNDSDTIRCTRGPAWTNATTRSLALTRVDGILVNSDTITNGPTSQLGTYVGTISTDGSTQCNMMFNPTPAAGGTANRLDVWNMYNRVDVAAMNLDSTDSWTYDTATFRAKNNNANNAITFVIGLAEDSLSACNNTMWITTGPGTTAGSISIGLDSTNTRHSNTTSIFSEASVSGLGCTASARLAIPAALGRHFLCPLESGFAGVGDITWFGDDQSQPGLFLISAFILLLRM